MRDQNQDVPLKVAFLHRIIFDVLVKPLRLDFWIPIDAELRHEARNDPDRILVQRRATRQRLRAAYRRDRRTHASLTERNGSR